MKVTTAVLTAAAALMLSAGASVAAPKSYNHGNTYHSGKHYNSGKHANHRFGLSPYERVAIARSAASLAALKRRAWADGRLTFRERVMINNAERRHAALVARAYRS